MPFIGDAGQFSNIYEKNYETTTLRIIEGDASYQSYNPADSNYKLITNLQEITDIGNVTSNTVQFSNAITGFTTTSNVGVANSTPTHTLDVGSKAYIDENASNTFWTSGTLYADKVLSETTEITNSVTTRDVLADKFFPKTNGFIEVTSNVGVLNTAPVHTLDIGANVQIDEYGSNTFWTSGNVYSEHYKGSNVTVSGSVDTDELIVNDINSKDTDFVNFTSNVGVLNTAPVHTLDIGANVQIDEYGSNTFWTSGNVHASNYSGNEITLTGTIVASDFILSGGSQATPTPDIQAISEVLAPGGGVPFSSDRTLTLSNATTSLDASVIQSITTKSNVIGNNVTAVTVNSNLIGNNVTAVTVNSNLIGNNVTAVTVNSNLIGNNVTAVTVNSNLIGNNVTAVTVSSNLIGDNVTAVTVNSNLVGNNVSAVTVNSNLVGNNVSAVTVNSNVIGNNVTAVTVNSNVIGNNVTAVTVNSNLIGNNVTAVTVNSNVIGNNVTAVTVNSNVIGNNVSASFISGNGDLIFRKYSFGVNGISAYTVIGPGFTTAANNPTLTLLRGQVYVFDNSTYYGSHPLQIRTSQGGTAYTNGVVDNGGGKLTFTVPMNAPIKLYYQCTNHSGMGNIIYIPLENLDTSKTLNLSNDLVVGTNKLFVDVSESRVGINKSTPTKTLDVTGEIACSSHLTVGGSVTATGTVSGSSSLTPGSYLNGSAYTGATNQTFNVDATDANTPSKVVARDGSGNFSAGTITASMSTSLTPGSYLNGSEYNGGTARTFNVDATDANTPSKVVARDGSGNFSAGTITATFSGNGSSLTDLDAGNLNSGTVSSDRLNLIASDIPSLNASKITSGTMTRPVDTTTVTIDDYLIHDGDSDTKIGFPVTDTFTVTTANGERLRVDSSGNVGIGTTNPAYKLDVHGTANVGVLTTTSVSGIGSDLTALNGDEVTTGTLSVDRIPDISANKITSDVLGVARIPDLSANKITSDVLGVARIPDLSASKITSDVLGVGRIPDLSANKITSDVLGVARIPDLSASKITSGTLSVPISTTIGSFSSSVGIGTTSPVGKLHLYQSGGGTDMIDKRTNISTSDNKQTLNYTHYSSVAQGASRDPDNSRGLWIGNMVDENDSAPSGANFAAFTNSFQFYGVTDRTKYDDGLSFTSNTDTLKYSDGDFIKVMYIGASGNVGIGTTSPTKKLDVNGTLSATAVYFSILSATSGYFSNYIYTDGNRSVIRGGSPTLYFRDTDQSSAMIHNNGNSLYILRGGNDTETWTQVNGQWPWIFNLSNNDSTCGGSLYCVGNVTAYSDIRHKKDILKLDNALEKVEKLNGYTYTRKDDGKRYTGLIAQEVLEVLPEAVIADEKGDYSLAYGNMVGLLIEAIKELKLEIDELKKSR